MRSRPRKPPRATVACLRLEGERRDLAGGGDEALAAVEHHRDEDDAEDELGPTAPCPRFAGRCCRRSGRWRAG